MGRGGSGHKHTARPSHWGGVGVRLFGRPHALRPKSTAPTTAAGGAGGQELYTQTRALEVPVWPCVSPRLGTWSSLLRHMDGPLDTNSAAAQPLIQNPPPPRRRRRGGGRGERGQKILNKNAEARHVQCTGPDQNALHQRPTTTATARTQSHAAQTQPHAPHVHVVPHRHTPETHRRQRAVAFQSLAERLHSFNANVIFCT